MVRDAFVISASVGVFGLSFGVLAEGAGLSVIQAQAMSLLVFTGASQFAAVAVVAVEGSPVTAVGSGLLLGLRNTAYGLALAPTFRGRVAPCLLGAHLVVDETAAMALARPAGPERGRAFWTTAAMEFAFWNTGTLAGALLGQGFGDPERLGLDVAFPAAFVVLVAPALRSRRGLAAAVIGVALALALVPVSPAGVPVIAAVAGALVAGARRAPAGAEVT